MTTLILTARTCSTPSLPLNIRGAARTLGLRLTRTAWLDTPREYILYDARAAFRLKIKLSHPDLGGDPRTAQAVIAAYKIVKRWATHRPALAAPPRPESKRKAALSAL